VRNTTPSVLAVRSATVGVDLLLVTGSESTSQAAFDKFGKTLMPILQQLGIDSGQPSVMPVHKVIVPAAKVSWDAKTKRIEIENYSALPVDLLNVQAKTP